MNNHIQILINKYKNSIKECKKDIYKVVDYLKENLNIIDVDVIGNEENQMYYNTQIEKAKINAFNSISNLKIDFDCTNLWNNKDMFIKKINNANKKFEYKDLDVLLFEVYKDLKSEKYYKEFIEDGVIPEKIIVMVEIKTGYIYSNNCLLYNELSVYKGVEKSDILNKTPIFIDYLSSIEKLFDNY